MMDLNIKHKNVIQILGFSIANCNRPLIVLEYVELGSMDKHLNNLTPAQQNQIILGIVEGMEYLHNHKIIHRDLACRNILLTADYCPKIADFGFARVLDGNNTEQVTAQATGPIAWMAPEAINRVYSFKSDVWMFGITVWEIFHCTKPHGGWNFLDLAFKIRDEGYTPNIASNILTKWTVIMQWCWHLDPIDRPTFTQLKDYLSSQLTL